MNVTYEKKNKMTFIGYHTEISPEEAYQKCPEFWDKEYAAKYTRLWQTMQPENAVEKGIKELHSLSDRGLSGYGGQLSAFQRKDAVQEDRGNAAGNPPCGK